MSDAASRSPRQSPGARPIPQDDPFAQSAPVTDTDIVCAFEIFPGGKTRAFATPEPRSEERSTDALYRWIHLHHTQGADHQWLRDQSGLDQVVQDALLAAETRPRCTPHKSGALLNLRGVNLNPGADPEDMVSIRIWVDAHEIISVRLRQLMAVRDLRMRMEEGDAPATTGDFIAALAEGLTERMEPAILAVSDKVDELEDEMTANAGTGPLRTRLAALRHTAVILRRFISPQRDALARLAAGGFDFLSDRNLLQLRETAERVTRMVEELDATRERAAVLHDQLTDRQAEEMNRIMLVLSIVAAIFLPMTFITGLLGMNVGGVPWAESIHGFGIVIGICVVTGIAMGAVFRRIGWF